MKSSVAFFMLPEPGHILPSLRVAKSLQAEGHAVSYVSIPGLEGYFARLGFPCRTVLKDVLPDGNARDVLEASAGVDVQRKLFAHLAATNTSLGDFLSRALRSIECDLLVCDAVIMKACGDRLCASLECPVVSLSVILPDDVALQRIHVRNIVLCPEEFELPSVLEAANGYSCYTEPSIYRDRPPADFPWDAVSLERPLVYCSLGTQSVRYPGGLAVLQAIIEAFEQAPDLQLVMSAGNGLAQLRAGLVPPNVLLVRSAPQIELLGCASLFITHGGLGSLKESVMSGVPAVVIPFDLDQPGNAERAEYHRIGLSCAPAACTARRMSDLVRTVLDDAGIHSGVTRMRRVFWAREMQKRAARSIDMQLESIRKPLVN